MPFSRRLLIAILSILMLSFIMGGMTQLAHAQAPVTVQAKIEWVYGPKPPIQLQLFHKSEIVDEEPVSTDAIRDPDANGTCKWLDVQTHDGSGNEFTFTFKQHYWDAIKNKFVVGNPPDYNVTTELNELFNFKITNTYVIPKTSITANKIWDGGPTTKPDTWFRLYRKISSGTEEPVPLTEAPVKAIPTVGPFQVSWSELLATDPDGNAYTFSVREGIWNSETNTFIEGSPKFFVAEYSLDRLTITNTFTPSVTATKVWVGGPTTKPTIWFKLFRRIGTGPVEEVPYAEVKPLPNGTTFVTWAGQDVDYEEGKYYTFSVQEVDGQGLPLSLASYTTVEAGLTVTNTYKIPKAGQYSVTKMWEKGGTPRPNIAFQLYRKTEAMSEAEPVPDGLVPLFNGDSPAIWTDLEETDINLLPYTFTIQELHLSSNGNGFVSGPPPNYENTIAYSSPKSALVLNTFKSDLIDILVTKNWISAIDPVPTIGFKLYRESIALPKQAVATAPLKELLPGAKGVVWSDLEKYDDKANLYKYSVVEGTWNEGKTVFKEDPPPDYLVEYSADGLTVTNTYSLRKTVTATKNWEGGPATKPTIWFKLYRQIEGGTPEEVPLTEAPLKELPNGTTSVSWQIENEKDPNNKPYTFSVREGIWNAATTTFTEGAPQYFVASYSTDGLTVTNTFTPSVTATKTWVNGPAAKPEIWFKLYRQIESGPIEAVPGALIIKLPNGTTSVTWTDQDVDYEEGKYYTFSVQEVNAAGVSFEPANYKKTEAGLTVTNNYVIPKNATASFTKVWIYGPTVKPAAWFKLYRKTTTGIDQEVPVEEAPVTAIPTSAPLKVTWNNLSATDINGNPYSFYIKEGTYNTTSKVFTEGLTNYVKTVSTDGLTITNTYVSPKINVIGYKVWSGGPAAKPNIQLQLYRNGTAFGSPYTLTGNLTSYTWANMDQTDLNGATYQYTIDEVSVPAYYSKRVNGMTVTNTYTGTIPYTGDNTHNARWLLLLLGLSALLPLAHWLDLKLLTRR